MSEKIYLKSVEQIETLTRRVLELEEKLELAEKEILRLRLSDVENSDRSQAALDDSEKCEHIARQKLIYARKWLERIKENSCCLLEECRHDRFCVQQVAKQALAALDEK